jgi:signal-transduction protein with cAMP-binding, CBS, and nucleotidyltransferase domain
MEDMINEHYFLRFDVKRTTLLPIVDLAKYLPLYKKKGEEFGIDYQPRLFTKEVLEKHGVLDQYELYEHSETV